MSIEAKLIAALALLIALIGENWYVLNMGKRIERADWQAQESTRKSAEAAALFKAGENNLRIQQDNAAKARKVSSDYQKELAAARAFVPATGSLRLPRAICDNPATGTEATSASGFDGAVAGTVALPDALANDLWQLVKDADEASAVARGLQSFVKINGLYGQDEAK